MRTTVIAAATAGLVLAAVFGVMRAVGSDPTVLATEWLGDIALAAVFATPAVLALIGSRGRPAGLLAGGLLGLGLGILAFPISALLWIPSAVYLVAYGRERDDASVGWRLVPALLAVMLGGAALFVLFAHDQAVCWATLRDGTSMSVPPEGFVRGSSTSIDSRALPPGTREAGCTSDTITPLEALGAFGVVVCAIALVATPPRPASPMSTRGSAPGGGTAGTPPVSGPG